jgi:hypothetical protein
MSLSLRLRMPSTYLMTTHRHSLCSTPPIHSTHYATHCRCIPNLTHGKLKLGIYPATTATHTITYQKTLGLTYCHLL